MKPPVPYYGGKITLAPAIAALLPDHRHYVEPFAGSLAVLLAKPPSTMETVNDLDGEVVNFWRVLRDRPADLARVCALTPHSRAEYDAAADMDTPDDLERARRLWMRLTQARAGRLVRAGWRHYVNPGIVSTAFPSYLDGYVERIAVAAERLHRVSLECRPAVEIIDRYGASPDVLLYVDPPYLGSTRANDRSYRHELLTDAEHRGLADALRTCQASVVISGYPSDLYDRELFGDWDRREFATSTYQGGTRSARTEVLWSNRPLVSAVQPDLFAS